MNEKKLAFGYTVSKDRQIDFDEASLELYNKVCAAEPSIRLCISCGTCAATCSAAKFSDFSLRKLILQVRRGITKGLQAEVSKCMLCGKCQLACPRGVSTRALIMQINMNLQKTGK
ncbi:MAG: 4Fe-4S dicluster domain-containing protein [Bacteroidales bacterium]|nr:4Fe-4S dicluster domain-containing protein [Bacteroidales bacterium]